jgi:hypothetical protein
VSGVVAALNIVLGCAYTGYGVLTIIDLKRGWRRFGYSHFGGAWVAMAFTCGPHHLAHGWHMAVEGRTAGPLDLLAVLVGLPFGVIWLSLRIEAVLGGRGDRFVPGTPLYIAAAPTLAAVYATVVLAGVVWVRQSGPVSWSAAVPNVPLVVIYCAIGYVLLRTQLRNRAATGGWSLSGSSLTVVFPTCAIMHGVFALYALSGLYHSDVHGMVIDWLAIPAGLYFLWVVRGLYLQVLNDWNQPTLAVETAATVG